MAKRGEKKTILVIEDEAEIRHFISRVLEFEGYRVLEAKDGDEGLGLLRGGNIGLVLLDLSLPGRDGWSVIAEMKEEPELSAIPIVVVTASAGVSQRGRALSIGAADYIVKPLSAASIREAVNRILDGRRRC